MPTKMMKMKWTWTPTTLTRDEGTDNDDNDDKNTDNDDIVVMDADTRRTYRLRDGGLRLQIVDEDKQT